MADGRCYFSFRKNLYFIKIINKGWILKLICSMTKKIYTCKSSFSLSLFCDNSLKQTWEILIAVQYVSYVKSFISVAVRICQRRQWHPTPVLLPGKSCGRRSLVGCSPWGHKESDMTERLHFHFSLSCIGERNGNPLQCSCKENPRDGGAWWATVCGVTQSRTRLKRLSSSSKNLLKAIIC